MALKKYLILILLFSGFLSAQNLFFTDSYQTNLYAHSENKIIFNNDVFSLVDTSSKKEILILIAQYFEDISVKSIIFESENASQLIFEYTSTSDQPLAWSKVWHTKYEAKLTSILNDYLNEYFADGIDYAATIKEAVIKKQAYYAIRTFKDRSNSYNKTRLHFSIAGADVDWFREENIAPNLSLNRIVTNSSYFYYNEAYPVKDIEHPSIFILGPNSKSRMTDCISMHLFVKHNKLKMPMYLSGHSVFVLDSLHQFTPIDETSLMVLLPAVKKDLERLMNSLAYSFYNVYDKETLESVLDSYQLEDYDVFVNRYIIENSYNIAQSMVNSELCFDKSVLDEIVSFKANSYALLGHKDTLVLNELATFLLRNEIDDMMILAYAGRAEYTKIDRKKFLALINKYKEYTPVKSSKRPDLSIYRAVVIFDYLVEKGVHPASISCMSNVFKSEKENYAFAEFKFK